MRQSVSRTAISSSNPAIMGAKIPIRQFATMIVPEIARSMGSEAPSGWSLVTVNIPSDPRRRSASWLTAVLVGVSWTSLVGGGKCAGIGGEAPLPAADHARQAESDRCEPQLHHVGNLVSVGGSDHRPHRAVARAR